MAKERRGICPVCSEERSVTAAGNVREHSGDIWVGGYRQVCLGSGQPPLSYLVDLLVQQAEDERDNALAEVERRTGESSFWKHRATALAARLERAERVVEAAEHYRRLYATDLNKETTFLGPRQQALLTTVDAYRTAPSTQEPRPSHVDPKSAILAEVARLEGLAARTRTFLAGLVQASRFDQCDDTCTADCGHCKGQGPPTLDPEVIAVVDATVRNWEQHRDEARDTGEEPI